MMEYTKIESFGDKVIQMKEVFELSEERIKCILTQPCLVCIMGIYTKCELYMLEVIILDKILEVINLEKQYKSFFLNKISFDIKRGYIMGYIGPNGAGKTTTIKAILDIIQIDGGEIRLFGQNISKMQSDIKQRVGFVIGENAFYEFLTAKVYGKDYIEILF